MKEGLMW